MQPPLWILAENSVNDNRYQPGSFIGKLHEDAVWDHAKYWQLEWALHELVNSDAQRPVQSIFGIFSSTMLQFSCHFDPLDGFAISNLDDEEIREYRERFQLVFEGFVNGEIPSMDSFRQNPLMTEAE